LAAVAVPPLTVAVTKIESPFLTDPIPAACASITVLLLTAYVAVYPSALFTVTDVELTAVTVPRCTSMVWYPPPDFGTVNTPCTMPPLIGPRAKTPGPPGNRPSKPRQPWPVRDFGPGGAGLADGDGVGAVAAEIVLAAAVLLAEFVAA